MRCKNDTFVQIYCQVKKCIHYLVWFKHWSLFILVPKDDFKTYLFFFFTRRISQEDHQWCVDKVNDCNNPQHPTIIIIIIIIDALYLNLSIFRFKSRQTYQENPTDLTILPLKAGPEIVKKTMFYQTRLKGNFGRRMNGNQRSWSKF